MASQELLDYDFKNVSYETREDIEKNDNEMDVWINLERSRNQQELLMLLVICCVLNSENNFRP